MAHPNGGSGGKFNAKHSFLEAYGFVGPQGVKFASTTGEQITATQALARKKTTPVIVFQGERSRHGSACKACWGFRIDCNRSRIGQCAEALDSLISRRPVPHPATEPTSRIQGEPDALDHGGDGIVTADNLSRWPRSLLRLLDALDSLSAQRESPTARISRLSREGRIRREIASCMKLVAEMRNVAEYEGKQLSVVEGAAAKNAWLAIEAWARESNIKFKL